MYDVVLSEVTPEAGRPYHEAQLSIGGETFTADTKYGSWRVHVDGIVRELLPTVAADLQAEVGGPARKRR